MTKTSEPVSISLDPGWSEIRDGVRRVCERFPNEYWVKLDHGGPHLLQLAGASASDSLDNGVNPSALVLSFGGYSPEANAYAWGFTRIPSLLGRPYACVLAVQGETTDDAGPSYFCRDSCCYDHPGIR